MPDEVLSPIVPDWPDDVPVVDGAEPSDADTGHDHGPDDVLQLVHDDEPGRGGR